MTAKKNPWDRLPQETDKAYNAFVVFLQMYPSRSVSRLRKKTGLTVRSMYKLAKRYRWRARTDAYDKWQMDQYVSTTRDEIKSAARNHVRYARKTMQTLAIPMIAVNQQLRKDWPRYLRELNTKSLEEKLDLVERLAKFLKTLVLVENLSLGNAAGDTSAVEETHTATMREADDREQAVGDDPDLLLMWNQITRAMSERNARRRESLLRDSEKDKP